LATSTLVALQGAQEPQLELAPEYETSGGSEAIDLAEAAGLCLDPWQCRVLDTSLGERRDGSGRYIWTCRSIVVVVSRQNGKGSLLEARVLYAATQETDQTIAWTAHEIRTAKEAFTRFVRLVRSSPELFEQVKAIRQANGQEAVEFHNGSRVLFTTRTKGALRGFTINLLIIDEAYALTEEQSSAILPVISAVWNPQVWYTSSPPLDSLTGESLFLLRESALRRAPGLGYFDWGLQGYDLSTIAGLDLDNPEYHRLTNPAYGQRPDGSGISAEAIAAERASMGREAFARERLGIWPPRAGGGMIDLAMWSELAEPESIAGEYSAIALDVTPSRDYGAIALYSVRPDGIGHVQLLDHRPGTDWMVERTLQLRQRWNAVAVAIDLRSPAGSLIGELAERGVRESEDKERPRRGDLIIPNTQDVAGATGQLIDAVRQATLRHIGDLPLTVAVGGAKTRPIGDAWGWGRRLSTIDISPLCAATLARWAYLSRVDLVRNKYNALANLW
jgi:hypothetical protein